MRNIASMAVSIPFDDPTFWGHLH